MIIEDRTCGNSDDAFFEYMSVKMQAGAKKSESQAVRNIKDEKYHKC